MLELESDMRGAWLYDRVPFLPDRVVLSKPIGTRNIKSFVRGVVVVLAPSTRIGRITLPRICNGDVGQALIRDNDIRPVVLDFRVRL